MEVGKLTVQHRSKTGKGISRSTRRDGEVPGVCYGFGMERPLAVTLSVKALKASFDPERRRNTVIDLTIEGDKQMTVKAMLWDFQVHPLKQTVMHVDLKSIDPDKTVEAVVPIASTGTHKGLVEGGWIQENTRLGAPFGQFNQDFPRGGETWQMLILKFLALFSDSPGLIVNFYFIFGFGLLAPSGSYAAGVTFVARDVVQRSAGRRAAIAAGISG